MWRSLSSSAQASTSSNRAGELLATGSSLPEAGPLHLAGSALGVRRSLKADDHFEVLLVLTGGVSLGILGAGLWAVAEGAVLVGHGILLDPASRGPGVHSAMSDKCNYRAWQEQRRMPFSEPHDDAADDGLLEQALLTGCVARRGSRTLWKSPFDGGYKREVNMLIFDIGRHSCGRDCTATWRQGLWNNGSPFGCECSRLETSF